MVALGFRGCWITFLHILNVQTGAYCRYNGVEAIRHTLASLKLSVLLNWSQPSRFSAGKKIQKNSMKRHSNSSKKTLESLTPCPQCGEYVSTRRGALAQHIKKSGKPHKHVFFKKKQFDKSMEDVSMESGMGMEIDDEGVPPDPFPCAQSITIDRNLGRLELYFPDGVPLPANVP